MSKNKSPKTPNNPKPQSQVYIAICGSQGVGKTTLSALIGALLGAAGARIELGTGAESRAVDEGGWTVLNAAKIQIGHKVPRIRARPAIQVAIELRGDAPAALGALPHLLCNRLRVTGMGRLHVDVYESRAPYRREQTAAMGGPEGAAKARDEAACVEALRGVRVRLETHLELPSRPLYQSDDHVFGGR